MKKVRECINERRSVRSYEEKQIGDADLNLIVNAGLYAPTGMGTQDRHFTAILNKSKLHELNAAAKNACSISNSPSLKERASDDGFSIFYHAPTLIIVSAGLDNVTPVSDCAVALQNMFLAAHSLGISSCWINAFNDLQKDPGVRRLLTSLGVPEDHTVHGSGAFGYAAGEMPKPAPRREGKVIIVK